MTSREDPAGWLVYRCPGSETGDLEDRLGELGHKVWTPRVWFKKRVPRKRLYRVVLLSMLPSYLFVSRHADLEALAALGAKHGFWGPMAIRGVRVELRDQDLDGLRAADDRTSRPRKWIEPLEEPVHRPRVVVQPLVTDRISGGLISSRTETASAHSGGASSDISRGASSDISRGASSDISRGASAPVGGTGEFQILQDELGKGDSVRVAFGPLASLGLVATVEKVEGGQVWISAFGGRVQMPREHLMKQEA
jgi:hypothetical protein